MFVISVEESFYFYFQTNTFQGIVITDGTTSFAVFIYKCGDLNWESGTSIGFSAAGDLFANHPFAGRPDAQLLDCINQPANDYVNVIYAISSISAIPPPISPDTGMYIHVYSIAKKGNPYTKYLSS